MPTGPKPRSFARSCCLPELRRWLTLARLSSALALHCSSSAHTNRGSHTPTFLGPLSRVC